MIGWRDYVRWQGMTSMAGPGLRGPRPYVVGCVDCRYAAPSGVEGHWRCLHPAGAGRGRVRDPKDDCARFGLRH
jgi:hypothetical protein